MLSATVAAMPHRAYGHDPEQRYRAWLKDRARDATKIVEVGVLTGVTTRRMAKATTGVIWAVDHWRGVPHDPVQAPIYRNLGRSEAAFRRRLAPWLNSGRVRVLKMDSVEASEVLAATEGRTLDLVFLDGDHSYEGVRRDILAWLPLVRPGGILSGHDLNWPGVRRAVEELLPAYRDAAGGFCWWTEVSA
jgi:predicted O-methyltransferase YrrM